MASNRLQTYKTLAATYRNEMATATMNVSNAAIARDEAKAALDKSEAAFIAAMKERRALADQLAGVNALIWQIEDAELTAERETEREALANY